MYDKFASKPSKNTAETVLMPIVRRSRKELKKRLQQRLNILVIAISDQWGGLEKTILEDIKTLLSSKLSVTLLVKSKSLIEGQVQREQVPIKVETYSQLSQFLFDPNLMNTIRRLIEVEKINFLHCYHEPLLFSIVPALARNANVGLILNGEYVKEKSYKRNLFYRLLYRRVDYVLASSIVMKCQLLRKLPVPEKKIQTIGRGLKLDHFGRASVKYEIQKWKLDKNCFLVGIVNEGSSPKHRGVLIKALYKLKKKIPSIHGIIIELGNVPLDPKYLESLRQLMDELQMGPDISIIKLEKDAASGIAAFDLFVVPSAEEEMASLALEAMAMGVPALLPRGEITEEIALNGCGFLFHPGDAFDLSNKIEYLYNKADHRKKLAGEMRKLVLQHHSTKRRLRDMLAIYARCSKRRRISTHD